MALVDATTENLHLSAYAYQPVFVYGPKERVFPILPEAWLTHATSARWESRRGDPADLPVDPYRRGTAIARLAGGGVERLGGTPNDRAAGRPVQLTEDPDDPDAIGSTEYRTGEHFLVVGGWQPGGRAAGDRQYLYRAFSELSAVMNPAECAWEPTDGDPHLPHSWVPQPVTPTVMVEAEWCGTYVEAGGMPGANAGAQHPLDRYLAMTYYLLYPYRGHAPGSTAPPALEGQWEAVTLFFPGEPGAKLPSGRAAFRYEDLPAWVALSKGITGTREAARWDCEVLPFDDARVERVLGNMRVYVGTGTHRNHFAPAEGTVRSQRPSGPAHGINYDRPFEFPGMEGVLVACLAAAAAAIVAGIAAGIAASLGFLLLGMLIGVLAAILFVVAVVALVIVYLFQAVVDGVHLFTSGRGEDRWRDTDETKHPSPIAAAAGAPPSPTAVPGGGVAAPPGAPNTGEGEGRDVVFADLRLVDRFRPPAGPTPYPCPTPGEQPAWWSYAGAWGVPVESGLSAVWQDGMPRVDAQGRTWGYWHAAKLCEHL